MTPQKSLSYRIRELHQKKVPFMLVIGDRELDQQVISVREREDKKSRLMSISEFVTLLRTRLDQELLAT